MIIGKKGLAIFTKGEEIQAGMEDQAFSWGPRLVSQDLDSDIWSWI
jgi:hypothetical protein